MEADPDSIDDNSDSSVGENFILKEFKKAKKQKTKESSGQSDHIECNFILGSAAVVKTLWSMYEGVHEGYGGVGMVVGVLLGLGS
jgi:hypothetical protein